jgi:hypothetical protein
MTDSTCVCGLTVAASLQKALYFSISVFTDGTWTSSSSVSGGFVCAYDEHSFACSSMPDNLYLLH